MSDLGRPSVGSTVARRAQKLLDDLVPASGRWGGVHRALRNAIDIGAEDGLATLGIRSLAKAARVCGRRMGLGIEGHYAWAASQRATLLRAIASDAKVNEAGCTSSRGLTEIAHILGRDCQQCSHFRGGRCSLITAPTETGAHRRFHELLLDPKAECPVGVWPGSESPRLKRLNLVYYIFPLQHPEQVWQWNVSELLKRLPVFNGRRIVTIATVPGGSIGPGRFVDPPEAVIEAFAGHDVEFRIVPNDPQRQEAAHFLSAMREIASTDPTEAVFYAHAKGVTRPIQGGEAIRQWTTAMYEHNLDRIDEVADLLRRWPCVGIAKKYGFPEMFVQGRARRDWGEGGRPWHGWHYAGTFWWARHDSLFSRPDWDQIELFPYATEKYLGNFFRAEEAICLAYDDCARPYDLATWREGAEPDRSCRAADVPRKAA